VKPTKTKDEKMKTNKFESETEAKAHLIARGWIYVASRGEWKPKGASLRNGKMWKRGHVYQEAGKWVVEIVSVHTSPGCA